MTYKLVHSEHQLIINGYMQSFENKLQFITNLYLTWKETTGVDKETGYASIDSTAIKRNLIQPAK